MNNSRPDTSFSVAGTDLTWLGKPDETPLWVKTRRTMSLPLWQHQVSLVQTEGISSLVYHDDPQHFRIKAPSSVWLGRYLDQRDQLPGADPVAVTLGLLNLLDQWHRQGIALLGLTPRHLLYRPETNDFWMADWSLALPYADLASGMIGNRLPDEVIAYASPEQTGKTDLPLDYRSDYFSLGVLLYRFTTGRLPFEGLDNASIIYQVLTHEPELARRLNPSLSAGFDQILSRLLSKNPDSRYQSSDGLRHDLTLISQADFNPVTFRPGQADNPNQFIARPVLVGRQLLVQALQELIQQVQELQQKGVGLLMGALGSGKTALLHQLEADHITDHFIIVSDLRDDQVQPFLTLKAGLDRLVDHMLGQDMSLLNELQFYLDAQIGNVLSVLIDFCPSIRKLIDTEGTVLPAMTGTVNQERLAYVVAGFLRSLALTGRPVLWLLDNLHGVSDATLRLLDALIREAGLTNITFVMAASPAEVSSTVAIQRIKVFVDSLSKLEHVQAKVLPLSNLTTNELAEWLRELAIHTDSIATVAPLIYQKTAGNPYSVQRLLQQMAEQNVVSKAAGAYFFRIDTDRLATFQASDNLLDYLTEQIWQLPPDARSLFNQTACFRSPFTLHELATITGLPAHHLQQQLTCLLDAGIVIQDKTSATAYQFANPQLATIGRQLLTTTERTAALANAAAYRFAHDDLSRTTELFPFVDTLFDLPPTEGAAFADALLRAGNEATVIGAYELALRCYSYVVNLFTETDWNTRFDTCFDIYNQYLLVVAYAEGKQALFEQVGAFLQQKARHKEDQAVINYTYGRGLLYQQRPDQAIEVSLPVLRQFNVDLPAKPTPLHIIGSSIRAGLLLRNQTPDQLEHLPEPNTTDPRIRLIINILANVSLSAALVRPQLLPVIMLHQLRASVQIGLTADSAAGFLMYAMVQSSFRGNYGTGFEMMELAIRLCRRFNSVSIEHSCYLVKAIYILHWVAPLQESLDLLLDTYRRSRENGLLTNAFQALSTSCTVSLLSELPLEIVLQRSLDANRLVNLRSQSSESIRCRLVVQLAHDLLLPQPDDKPLAGPHADFNELHIALQESHNHTLQHSLLMMRMLYCVHLRRPGDLADYVLFRQYVRSQGEGTFISPFGYFYGGLLSLQQPGPFTNRQKRLARSAIAKLNAYSQVYEGNNRSRYLLLKSIYLLRTGQAEQGLAVLDEALEVATRYKQTVEEALGRETKARHYLSRNQTVLGGRELREALRLYEAWGASAIVGRLQAEFPFLAESVSAFALSPSDAGEPGIGAIDLNSFLKLSSTLNSNLRLDNLLPNLLNVLLENAGAQKAALLLNETGLLRVHAIKEPNEAISLEVQPLEQANLPKNPIQYVIRTAKPLVLAQAYTDRIFSADAYFRRNRTLSVLVMPVVKNRQLLAIIYLENNSTSGAFTSRRLEVLQLLAAQIAISLENSLLYDEMEGRVEERTQQLRQEKDTSEALLLNILPKAVAEELKQTGRAAARKFEDVTVMFTDFVNFTRIAEQMAPEDLVAELDFCFGKFDQITEQYGIEKIKTIGDAYLCAGGLTEGNPNHTDDVVRAGLMIQQFIIDRKNQRQAEGKPFFEVRIGVHNGPLVAGVVGTRKFAYDIWGDTVNTAARIEQNSEPGRVNVSGRTWQVIQTQFSGTFRGRINAKNKGAIDMYFIDEVLG